MNDVHFSILGKRNRLFSYRGYKWEPIVCRISTKTQ